MSRDDANFHRDVGLLALGLTLLRLLAAGVIHLTEDEAYYRLWAMHLHLGYYDHPPMIAWWIRAGTALADDTALGVRLVAVLAGGFATWLVADLARLLGAKTSTALRAAVWYNATLTIGVGGILATPDAPAILYSALTLWSIAKVWAGGPSRWWLMAGLTAGLASISKYSALFLGPGVFLWMCLTPWGRKAFASRWPWLALIVAEAIFATNVLWNAQHGWLTFAKQFGRITPHRFAPDHLADLLVAQFFLLNPLIAVYAAKGVAQAWRGRHDPNAVHLLLPLAAGLPFAVYLMLHSLHDRVQAHWPVPLFAGLAITAAVAVERASAARTARILRGTAVGLSFALSATILVLAATGVTPVTSHRDPFAALKGWPQFARDIEVQRRASGAAWVGTASYGVLAQLSATGAIGAPLFQVIERARYRDDIPNPDLSKPGLIIDLARRLTIEDLQGCFGLVTPVGLISRAGSQSYEAYRVANPLSDLIGHGCPNDLGKTPR